MKLGQFFFAKGFKCKINNYNFHISSANCNTKKTCNIFINKITLVILFKNAFRYKFIDMLIRNLPRDS